VGGGGLFYLILSQSYEIIKIKLLIAFHYQLMILITVGKLEVVGKYFLPL
jgi:hypothetical protein